MIDRRVSHGKEERLRWEGFVKQVGFKLGAKEWGSCWNVVYKETRILAINVSIPNVTVARLAWSSSNRRKYKSRQSDQQTQGLTENKPSFIQKHHVVISSPIRVHLQLILSKSWLPWQRPLVAGYRQYLHSVGRPLKRPSITTPFHNQSPNCYRLHKASYSNFSPKIGCPLDPRSRLCLHWIAWSRKPTPIKNL